MATGVVVGLDDRAALRPEVVGAKAAALARALRAGLPVLPGRVLTTDVFGSPPTAALDAELATAWQAMSGGGSRRVVVRSSSTVEDGPTSSMAGMFTSVLDVGDWSAFRRAVDAVLESSRVVALADSGARERGRAAMAVLVQPQLTVVVGGVMFGVDPVSGADRLVISASPAGPSAVVSGEVDGTRYAVSRRRVVEGPAAGAGPLSRHQVRLLGRLGHHAERVFGGPQDVEWAFDADGKLWLLQSRPVTARAEPAVAGPVLGPGPVAETFPDPLSTLEEELWVDPLREGLRLALALAGATPRRRLARSAVVTTVGGRVAADLALLGVDRATPSLLGRLDPRPSVRRLVAAWRVGRLRAALPSLAEDLLATADTDLLAVGALSDMGDDDLLGLLRRSSQALTALHGHEVLMGWLVAPTASSTTAASVALRALAAARAEGLADEEIVTRHPGVLALTPPRIAAGTMLPASAEGIADQGARPGDDPDRAAVLREALRLRARWVQELTARSAWELGARLQARGVVGDPGAVRWLHLDELAAAVATGVGPGTAAPGRSDRRVAAPLPARFRLTAAGAVVPEAAPHRAAGKGRPAGGGGTGAGGGRGMGPVHGGEGAPDPGAVLVVGTLDPGLAPLLPRLGGLVAETGSFLSHLAILARELGVPTAVGVEDAVTRFPAGTVVVVDGSTGEVVAADGDQEGAA